MATSAKAGSLFEGDNPQPEDLRTTMKIIRAQATAMLAQARSMLDACDAFDQQFPEAGIVKANPYRTRLLYFDQKHRERTATIAGKPEGMPAAIEWGRDMAIMKRIVDRYGEADTDSMIDDFFRNGGEYVQRQTGYTILAFQQTIPRIMSRRATGNAVAGITRNTEQNREQSRAAVDMIRASAARRPTTT